MLSRGGRLVLLNSVLSGIPSFFCSAFRLPKWVSSAIDKIRRGFFWKGRLLTNGFHCLVNWDTACRPKGLGGLGIRQLQPMNSALLMKGLWIFYSSPGLPWVQLLRSKHYKCRPLSLSNKFPSGCSPIWKEMLRLDLPFSTSVSFSLGSGKSLSFWNARWTGDFALRSLLPNLHAAAALKHLSVSSWLQ